MRRYGRYGETSAADLLASGLTDATILAQNQQNLAAQQAAAAMAAQESFFTQKALLGIPNWVLLLGGAAVVYVVVKK